MTIKEIINKLQEAIDQGIPEDSNVVRLGYGPVKDITGLRIISISSGIIIEPERK